MQGLSKAESVLLDCGLLTTEGICCNSVFITHGHIDHVGACISHARGEKSSLYNCHLVLYYSLKNRYQ